MISRILWGLCAMAGEASGDRDHFPQSLCTFFGWWCSIWYLLAMTAQGDSALWWKEYRENRRARIAQRLQTAKSAPDLDIDTVMA